MGGYVETTAMKLAKVNARWENMKGRIGEVIVESGLFEKALDVLEGAAIDLLRVLDPVAALMYEDKESLQKKLIKAKEDEWDLEKKINELEIKKDKTSALNLLKKTKLTAQIDSANKQLEKQLELEENITAELERRVKKVVPKDPSDRRKTPPISGAGIPEQTTPGIFGNILDPGRHQQLMDNLREQSSELQGLEDSWNNIGVAVNETANMMFDASMMLSDLIGDSIGGLFEALGAGELEGAFKDILGNFGQFIQDIGKMLVAYGSAMLAFSLLSKSPDPISAGLAIAAGLTAIAIGGAIKGAASKGNDALSGGGTGGYAGGTGTPTPQQLTVQIEGTLKGSDIAISSRRYNNNINSVT